MSENKYVDLVNESKVTTNDAEVNAAVEKILAEHYAENNTAAVHKFLLGAIDLTTLKSTDSPASVADFTQKVNEFEEKYPDLPSVAAICVYPNFAQVVRTVLDVSEVDVCCVSGCFPSSQSFIEVKVAEVALAVEGGADEIDIVLNMGNFLDGDYQEVVDEITELKHSCRDARMKVILETGALRTAENIRNASILSVYSGADFIKTSTGFSTAGATFADIELFARCCAGRCKIKAAGGISTLDDAVRFIELGADRLGTSRMVKLVQGLSGEGY